MTRIALVAGEPSGDLLGAELMNAVRARRHDIAFCGIGGPKMRAAGLECWHPMETLAVRGYVEVLRRYREIVAVRRQLIDRLRREPPALFIGIDAPDFNLEVERRLRARQVRTIHYVCPSIWAWRGERVSLLRDAADRVLALFPFEKPLLERSGVPTTYVGHPLADLLPEHPDRAGTRERLRLPSAGPVIALLPGSREGELEYMADLFVATAQKLHARLPDAQFLVPLVSRETRARFELAIYRCDAYALPLQILFGHSQVALTAADAALVASGTATLEAALLRCPMVITYRMADWSWRLMRGKGYLPYGGLPNILAGRFIVPELIQEHATADNLAQALANLIGDPPVRRGLADLFGRMHRDLRQGSAERTSSAVLEVLAG
ncbi:MAG: lipid-A-disaccharide synthase [Proteobacteria bacterium]|nr:lipid-A-disaccharide synthase [Burkholderiales bacterium]